MRFLLAALVVCLLAVPAAAFHGRERVVQQTTVFTAPAPRLSGPVGHYRTAYRAQTVFLPLGLRASYYPGAGLSYYTPSAGLGYSSYAAPTCPQPPPLPNPGAAPLQAPQVYRDVAPQCPNQAAFAPLLGAPSYSYSGGYGYSSGIPFRAPVGYGYGASGQFFRAPVGGYSAAREAVGGGVISTTTTTQQQGFLGRRSVSSTTTTIR